jgi:hypothetical protein
MKKPKFVAVEVIFLSGVRGAKLTPAEIGRRMRAEIRAKIKAGKLPPGKYKIESSENFVAAVISDVVLPTGRSVIQLGKSDLLWDEGGRTERYGHALRPVGHKILADVVGILRRYSPRSRMIVKYDDTWMFYEEQRLREGGVHQYAYEDAVRTTPKTMRELDLEIRELDRKYDL